MPLTKPSLSVNPSRRCCSQRRAIARHRAGLRHHPDVGAARIDDVGALLLGTMLDEQLFQLASRPAGLESDFYKWILTFEGFDQLPRPVARHRRIPNDLAFLACFPLKRFAARFFRHAINLIQPFFHRRRTC